MNEAHQIPLVPLTEAEAFFGLLYSAHMQPFPRRFVRKKLGQGHTHDNERQWVFVGSKEQMKSIATQSTLYTVLSDATRDNTYFTPNGYYRRDLRLTETLRWLNAYVFDLDCSGESLTDVFDRTDRAGLPRPTAIVKTPSGGYHIHYFFSEPVRATTKAIKLYTAIMGHLANEIGSDSHAVGANRIFRTPTVESLIYFEPQNRYDFDEFKSWRDLNHPLVDYASDGNVYVHTNNLMNSAAVLQILHTRCNPGYREQTCFTLALAMKAEGWSEEAAKDSILEWHRNYCEQGGKESFSKRDALYKVHYVYKKSSLHAPSAEAIRELSGMPFYYARKTQWEAAKPREDRVRAHIQERKADLLELIRNEKELTGTQAELSSRISCPLSTYKLIVKNLVSEGVLKVETQRGRGGNTTIWLVDEEVAEEIQETLEETKERAESPEKPKKTTVYYVDFISKVLIRRNEVIEKQAISEDDPEPEPPG